MITGASGWRRLSALREVMVLAAAPNLLMVAAAFVLAAPRPFINLDFFLLGALSAVLSRRTLWVALGLLLAADTIFTFAPAFNFDPDDILGILPELRHVGVRAFVVSAVLVTTVGVIAAVLGRLRGPGRPFPTTLSCAVAALGLLALDALNGTNAVGYQGHVRLGVNLVTSRLYPLTRSLAAYAPASEEVSLSPVPAATDVLRNDLARFGTGDGEGPTKIVLVIVESLGELQDGGTERLFAPLHDLAVTGRYAVRTGAVPFDGATTSGELRELCGLRLSHRTLPRRRMEMCLPAQLRGLGYESVALHGFSGSLFRRRGWYPDIGFERSIFRDELQDRALPHCGLMFHGVCDESMAAVVREELRRAPDQRQFIYWLTLTSHFPLVSGDALHRCGVNDGRVGGRDENICALFGTIGAVIDAVASMAADPTVPPAWYIVVGDHAPPFLSASAAAFGNGRVPFIELRPEAGVRAGG